MQKSCPCSWVSRVELCPNSFKPYLFKKNNTYMMWLNFSVVLPGLTCIQKKAAREVGGEESMCILQLTEAGDIFYQILEPEQPDTSQPPTVEDEPLPQQAAKKLPQTTLKEATEQLRPDSQLVVSDTSSDEDIIEPTQGPTSQRLVAETPEREQRALNMFSDSSSDELKSMGTARNLRQLWLQVVVNEELELDQVGGLDAGLKDGKVDKDNTENTEEAPGSLSPVGPAERQTPVKLSDSALAMWKRWLQKLMLKSRKKKPRPRCLQHFTINTKGLLHLSDAEARDSTEEERVRSLRRDLRACMSKRSLLLHSTVSASLGAPDVAPLPNPVDTEIWTDHLSQRLSLSWQGEEAWRAWWEDQLGLNKEQKVEALKRKRRREKEAKRASGRRLELSGSFTSSVSYQSEPDNFSDTGWSSAASQGAWSDAESTQSQSVGSWKSWILGGTTPSDVQTDTPVPTPTATPQSVKDKQGDQQTPSSSRVLSLSQTPKPNSTPASQRRNKPPADNYLSSLFAPQVRGR